MDLNHVRLPIPPPGPTDTAKTAILANDSKLSMAVQKIDQKERGNRGGENRLRGGEAQPIVLLLDPEGHE
jgi:hypothetical protein